MWFSSQPLVELPSQLSNPALHAPSVHTPLGHEAAAVARAQGTPQPPQLVMVSVAVSHPLFGLPSQDAQKPEQVGEQADAAQATVPCALVHCTPQAPQSFGSDVRSRQTFEQQACVRHAELPAHDWPTSARQRWVEISQRKPAEHWASVEHDATQNPVEELQA